MFCTHLKNNPKVTRFCELCGAFWPSNGSRSIREIDNFTTVCIDPEEVLIKMHESNLLLGHDQNEDYLIYRKVLVEWLFEIGENLKIKMITIHIAVHIIDSSLAAAKITTSQLQGVALVSLVIASKCEDLIDDFVHIAEVANYTKIPKSRLKELELEVLDTINWNIKRVTPLHYIQLYNSLGILYDSDEIDSTDWLKVVRCVRKYTEFFADMCLQESQFLNYSSEEIALSCIACARKIVNINPIWSPELSELSKFDLNMNCCREIDSIYYKQFLGEEMKLK